MCCLISQDQNDCKNNQNAQGSLIAVNAGCIGVGVAACVNAAVLAEADCIGVLGTQGPNSPPAPITVPAGFTPTALPLPGLGGSGGGGQPAGLDAVLPSNKP